METNNLPGTTVNDPALLDEPAVARFLAALLGEPAVARLLLNGYAF